MNLLVPRAGVATEGGQGSIWRAAQPGAQHSAPTRTEGKAGDAGT